MTTRETILQALFILLQTVNAAKVLRNEVLPEKIPAGGLLILRDGDPGEPEVLLSPLSYYWQHRAQLEVVVQKGGAPDRDTALDDLLQAVAAAIASDRTLGGLCDRVTAFAPDTSTFAIKGGMSVKGVVVPIELIFTTSDPLA
ncbi:MAG: acyl-CoA transferase [Pseudomonadota bacterium]